ncbi:MAG TPA: signal peptidase II [Candidatus Moranbacteria bacterium]|nr:signal peptidase II [Candidatus Moranbacteria bacterium]
MKIKSAAFLVFLMAIDQLVKYIIRTSGGFYICNRGVAFGLPFFTVILFTIGLFLIFIVFNFKSLVFNYKSILSFKPASPASGFQISNYSEITILSAILIISGGLSNIADRFMFGCVIDFIDLGFWPVFNIADIYITIGAIILVIKNYKAKSL